MFSWGFEDSDSECDSFVVPSYSMMRDVDNKIEEGLSIESLSLTCRQMNRPYPWDMNSNIIEFAQVQKQRMNAEPTRPYDFAEDPDAALKTLQRIGAVID